MRIEIEARVRRSPAFTLDVSFACDADALGLVGPSGSGKSTLLDAIAGLEPARVVLDGDDVSRLPLHTRGVGYVTQDALLFPHLSVRANLLYSPRAGDPGDVPAALRIAHLLDRMPRHLSGGERRRAALARAVLSRPRLLLLDEPFAGLDETGRREAMALLASVRSRFGIPIVVVSHVPEEIVGLTAHAVRLDGGRVSATGPSASVLRAGETRIDNHFTGTVAGPRLVRVGGADLHVLLPPDAAGDVRLAVYANDIILARERPAAISARNCVATTVRSVTEAAGAALVDLDTPPVRAAITSEAAAALALAPGSPVVAIIKATAITYLGAAG